jgi:spore coat protein U-like protein
MNRWNARAAIAAALCLTGSLPALADGPSCKIGSVVGVGFGAYDVFSDAPNNSGVGRVTIQCNGIRRQTVVVTLSAGHSHSFAARILSSGGNSLAYNLYTSASRSVIWGDGTGGSSTMTVAGDASTSLSVYGQIPAGQDPGAGSYSDSILLTVEF